MQTIERDIVFMMRIIKRSYTVEMARGFEGESKSKDSYVRIECEEDVEELSDEVTGEESGEVTEGNNSRLDSEEDTRIRLSTRERRSHDRYGTWIYLTDQVVQPSTVTEALSGADREKWKDAMDAEHKSLISNNVWDLVELPKNTGAVNCKWIFKHKIGALELVE